LASRNCAVAHCDSVAGGERRGELWSNLESTIASIDGDGSMRKKRRFSLWLVSGK
jgi:hypothetical protein